MSSRTGGTGANLQDVKQVLERITKDCGKISVAKKESSQLASLCMTLSNRLSDRSLTPQQFDYDDVKSELIKVEEQLISWSKYGYPWSLMKKKEIETGLTGFAEKLGSIIHRFQATRHTSVSSRASNHGMNPLGRGSVEAIPQMDGTGKDTVVTVDHNNREPPSRRTTGHETLESYSVEANEVPPVKRLDGEIKRVGEIAFAGGKDFEVWVGRWEKAGEADAVKVALKTLRVIRSPEKMYPRLEREFPTWAQLRHPNILPFYGVVMDTEPPRLYMVSPWLENGNLLAYVKGNSQSDKNYLLRGSAAGLSYLHARGIVHGGVRCKNVLVSDEGEPQICDFGISRIMEEIDDSTTSKTMASGDVVRYSAPELIEHNKVSPTTYSDTYSFAMLILECITEEVPFSHIVRDAAVIHTRISKRQIPPRPDGLDGKNPFSDELWNLMMRCWSVKPDIRPTMEHVHTFFLHLPAQ